MKYHWLAITTFAVCFVAIAPVQPYLSFALFSDDWRAPYSVPLLCLVVFIALFYWADNSAPSRKREVMFGVAFALLALGMAQMTLTPWFINWRLQHPG